MGGCGLFAYTKEIWIVGRIFFKEGTESAVGECPVSTASSGKYWEVVKQEST